MATAYIEQYNKLHLIKKTPTHQNTVKQDSSTTFRPLTQIPDYKPQIIDP